MLLRGVNIFEPKNEAMYAWGAIFGPAVVFQGQLWRLPASMFLHFGLMHLAMNMWCLVSTGPVVERFFGHLSFAALYLIAGLGGAIASLVVHPTGLCAGASGAIFGVFGALLAFLAVRHRDVPAAILEPMRSGTLAFLGYNVVFGLMNKNIDMAGHLGGLATGFVAGLFLAGGWVTRNDGVGLLRRIGMIGALSAGLFPLARSGFGHAEGSILADPTMGPLLLAAPSWNEFVKELPPVLREFDRIGGEIDGIVNQLSRSELPVQRLEPAVNRLIADSDALGRRIAALPTRNAEIEAMRARLASARTNQGKALNFLKRFVAEGDPRIFNEKDGMKAVSDALKKDVEQFSALRAAYFKAHGLTEHALP